MRFIEINPKHRRAFDTHIPEQIGRETINRLLRCDFAVQIELTHDMDLWVPDDPRGTATFQFFNEGPRYFGSGVLVGRTKLDDIKSLPRVYNHAMVSSWLNFPALCIKRTKGGC